MAASAAEVMVTEPASPDHDGPDAGKKKRFFKLKNIKQLFTRKKRSKSKDDEVKALSVANVSAAVDSREDTTDDELDNPFPGSTSGALSVSHDSVFSPEKPRDPSIGDHVRSMERLPQGTGGAFKSELASKLQKRGRKDPSYKDEALPESPVNNSTAADVLMENGLRSRADRSYESDHSLMSMGDSSDNELEEDFFKGKWASNSSLSKRTASPDPGSGSDLDLDIISSTASLNISAAKHKIAIKQKGKRASALVLNRRKQNSPKPHAGSGQTLPDVQEEVVPKPPLKKEPSSDITEDEQITSTASLDSLDSTGTKSPMPQIEEPTADYDMKLSEEKQQEKTFLKPSPRLSSKRPQIKGPKPSLTKSVEQTNSDSNTEFKGKVSSVKVRTTSTSSTNEASSKETLEFTKIVLKKTSSNDKGDVSPVCDNTDENTKHVKVEEKKSNEQNEPKAESNVSSVVMRQKSIPQDSSKRQTIAVADPSALTESTPFGERKLNKRSSWIDSNRNWDDIKSDGNKDKGDNNKSERGSNNEFSQVFSKFQRRVSQKKIVDKPVKTVESEPSKDAMSGANITPQSVPSSISSASTKSQVSSASSKSVTTTKTVANVSETNTVESKTAKTKPTSFVINKSSGVQMSDSKPQPKAFGVEKTKSPDSPKLPPQQQQSSVSSPEKKIGDFFPKKTVIIENKPTATANVSKINKTTTSTTSSVVSSSVSSATKDSGNDKNKTSFVLNKPTTTVSSGINTSSSVSSGKNEPKSKTENDENTHPQTDVISSSIYRRPSPILKDRARSQTLPEQPVLTQKAANLNNSSDKLEKKVTPSPTASPQRSKSMIKPSPTTAIGEKSDGKPSWIAMAKKKTVGWNSEDGSNMEESKEVKQESNKGTKAEDNKMSSGNDSKKSIKDLMRKFQS